MVAWVCAALTSNLYNMFSKMTILSWESYIFKRCARLIYHVKLSLLTLILNLGYLLCSYSYVSLLWQSVIKLATLWGEKMRHMSNVWAPPIYRRLVSADKREREITERCLLKVRYLICPTPVTLSKVYVGNSGLSSMHVVMSIYLLRKVNLSFDWK